MGKSNSSDKKTDPKIILRIAITKGRYDKLLAQIAEAKLREVMMMVVGEEGVPEELKEAVRERYEEFEERRVSLVESQAEECERMTPFRPQE